LVIRKRVAYISQVQVEEYIHLENP